MSDQRDPVEALDPEDAKIVTLARSARARTGAAEGAAVRDTDGRTYSATSVALPSLLLSALQAAVAAAVSSGAPGLEAAAVVTASDSIDGASLAAVHDLAPAAHVLRADPGGAVRHIHTPQTPTTQIPAPQTSTETSA